VQKNWQKLSLAVLLALAVILAGTSPLMAGYIEDALAALQKAKLELMRGPVDKSGHRTKAMGLINEAMAELQKASRYEETHAASGKAGDHSKKPHQVNLNDLVGMRAGSLDTAMNSRGFTNKGGYKQGDTSFTTWWNASTNQCVSVATKQGRVHKIEAIFEGNCK